ncbi:hypothetical protein HYW82_04190 [Candidatus Peregrinibacteria bacterium]|nr:hypothetical protein [Candidatus Peregrinibacteria bacterium]
MKNVLAVIIGVVFGAAIAVTFINTDIAHGETEGDGDAGDTVGVWNEMVASADTIDWRDVFAPLDGDPGEDMYSLIYAKLNVLPRRNALKEVGFNYGLTTDEVDAALKGAIAPILNNPDNIGGRMTREDALATVKNLQEDYAMIFEVYELEQEVDATIRPSELFANGDLADSGFDLVHDLTVIEEILFKKDTPVTVGAPYKSALTSPYNPTIKERFYGRDYLTSETPEAVETSPYSISSALSAGDGGGGKRENLESDVCIDENSFKKALENFEGGEENDEAGVLRGGKEEEGERLLAPLATKALADDWRLEWCPELAAGAPGVSANLGLCLETKLVLDRVSPFQPKDSCVQCEVKKIIENLDKVLTHTLIPNKVTGNLFESAKCKTSGTFLDIQFITIWNPLPVPPNDDLIYSKSLSEEWDEFVGRYQSLLPYVDENNEQYTEDFQVRFQEQSAPKDLSREELFNAIAKIKAKNRSEAELGVKNIELGDSVGNVLLYGREVLGEMLQMNAMFENFNDMFEKMDEEALKKIKAKGYVY